MESLNSKKYFWILLDVLVLGIIVNLVFFVMPAIKHFGDSLAPARTISVTAEGKTIASPDVAEVSFSVVSQGTNPEQLAARNNDKMNAVIQNLTGQGIDKKDIKTTSYDLSPNYNYDRNTGRSYIYGYTLTQTLLVKIRDLAKAPAVVGGVTPLGVNQIGGISFTIDDPEKFLADARADGFKKAQAKAREMASANGVKLGALLGISDYQQNQPVPYFKEAAGFSAAPSSAPVPPPALESGTQELKVQVTLTYALE